MLRKDSNWTGSVRPFHTVISSNSFYLIQSIKQKTTKTNLNKFQNELNDVLIASHGKERYMDHLRFLVLNFKEFHRIKGPSRISTISN